MDLDLLRRVNEAEDDIVVEGEPLTGPVVDEPALDERFGEEELVTTHHSLFILDDGDCLELEGEGHSGQACFVGDPVPYMALLLIEDCELVVSSCQNHIDIQLILADELGLNAGVVVEASQRIMFKVFSVGLSVHPFKHCLELGRGRKVEAKRQVEEVGDRLFFGSSNREAGLEDLVEFL